MKIIITGHTSGLGLQIYNHYTNLGHEVIGLSRITGYDLEKDADSVIDFVKNNKCDYFFNNAYCHNVQTLLLEKLAPVVKVISSGSMGSNEYWINKTTNPYYINKYHLEMAHIEIKKNNPLPMLLLKMGYLENYKDKDPIMYSEVLHAIDFWLINPRVSMIEFGNINYDKNIKLI